MYAICQERRQLILRRVDENEFLYKKGRILIYLGFLWSNLYMMYSSET